MGFKRKFQHVVNTHLEEANVYENKTSSICKVQYYLICYNTQNIQFVLKCINNNNNNKSSFRH